jgi:outer membrane protein assembly factor BamB
MQLIMNDYLQAILVALGLAMIGCDGLTETGVPRLVWSQNAYRARAKPFADHDIAVFTAWSGLVTAFEAKTGAPRWSRTLGLPPEAGSRGMRSNGILGYQDLIIVPSWDIYALDRETGEERWRFADAEDFAGYGKAVVGEGRVYATGLYVYALDAKTGNLIWRVDLGEQPFSPLYADGTIYLSTRGIFGGALGAGHAIALDAATGEVLWKHPIPDAPSPETWKGGATGPGVITPETFIVAASNARVYGIDRNTGNTRWTYTSSNPFVAGVALIDGVAVVGNLGGKVEGLDVRTGERLWQIDVRGSVFYVDSGDDVALVNSHDLHMVDAAGRTGWTHGHPSLGIYSTGATAHDGVIYVGSEHRFKALHQSHVTCDRSTR